ncbi:acetyltransferase, partial [Melanogaster broomeanus]
TWPGLSHIAVNDMNEIVGLVCVRLKEEVKEATHAHIRSLSVLHAHRGQGIARQLMTRSLHSARTLFNVSEVTLHVRKSNKHAIELYTSLGFYQIMEKRRYCESQVIRPVSGSDISY